MLSTVMILFLIYNYYSDKNFKFPLLTTLVIFNISSVGVGTPDLILFQTPFAVHCKSAYVLDYAVMYHTQLSSTFPFSLLIMLVNVSWSVSEATNADNLLNLPTVKWLSEKMQA